MLDEEILNLYSNYNNDKSWDFSIIAVIKFYNVNNTAKNMRLCHFLYEQKENYNIFKMGWCP